MTIVFGGLAPMIVRAARTERFLAGRPWDGETLRLALDVLGEEVREWTEVASTVGRGEHRPRLSPQLAMGFFYKLFLHVAAAVDPSVVAPANLSAAEPARTPPVHGGRRSTPSTPSSTP